MAATANIVIANNAAANKTFIPSVQIPMGFQYRDNGSTADAPRTIDITHTAVSGASSSNAKHTFKVTQLRPNAAAQIRTGYFKCDISVPKDGLTATDVSDLAVFVRNFFTDANLQTLLLGGF